MNSVDINDPTAVMALLDQLKTSQVWRDTLNSTSSRIGSDRHPEGREPSSIDEQDESKPPSPDSAPPPPSVASLLSQLRTSQWPSNSFVATNTPPLSDTRTTHQSSRTISRTSQDLPPTLSEPRTPRPIAESSSTPVQDVRFMSFQQALPHLTQLASDPEFLAALSRLRQEQTELEKQLWEEREAIRRKHEDKVKVAQTKATMIGAGLSKHEADMMNDAYRRDLQKFDKERVLLAWDALVQKQQAALEALRVPTMFTTTSQADCQKQHKVIQVLEGL